MNEKTRAISKQKQKIVLDSVAEWVKGDTTTWMVAKRGKMNWYTAEKYLKRFAAQIDIKSDEITNKIVTKQLEPKTFVQRLTLSFMRLIHGEK